MNKEYEYQVSPRIVKNVDPADIERKSERHNVSFQHVDVIAFSDEGLRNTVANFWQPDYMTHDGKENSALWQILYKAGARGREMTSYGQSEFSDYPVAARIILTYPLQDIWESIVTFPADRFGILFAVAHDMYRHIYKLDDADWQAKVGDKDVPRLAPGCMNRAHGKYVWGHDISDLVFEYLYFRKAKEAKPLEKEDKPKGIDSIPLLGTVTFAIGS